MYIDLPTYGGIHELFVSMASEQPFFSSPSACSFAPVTAKSREPSCEYWHLRGWGRGLDRREWRKEARVVVWKVKVVQVIRKHSKFSIIVSEVQWQWHVPAGFKPFRLQHHTVEVCQWFDLTLQRSNCLLALCELPSCVSELLLLQQWQQFDSNSVMLIILFVQSSSEMMRLIIRVYQVQVLEREKN